MREMTLTRVKLGILPAVFLALGWIGCGPPTASKRAQGVLRTAGTDPMVLRKASLAEFDPLLGRTRCWCCKETLKSCFEGTLAGLGCPAG